MFPLQVMTLEHTCMVLNHVFFHERLLHLTGIVTCSQAEAKGSDCYEQFRTMQECMLKYPTVYGNNDDDKSSTPLEPEDEEHSQESEVTSTAATKAPT